MQPDLPPFTMETLSVTWVLYRRHYALRDELNLLFLDYPTLVGACA